MTGVYITRLSAWAPGIGTGEWGEWASGKRGIASEVKGPEITYTDSVFRRRLSQISKMTVHVIHGLLPLKDDTKIFFLSFRGELCREYQIFRMLIEDGELSPAAFSLSGFNTPVALATIAFGLKGGYTALYPEKNSFTAGVQAAEAALLSGTADELALVYADENIPPECGRFFRESPVPIAFSLLLSRNPGQPSVPLSSLKGETDNPLAFLKQLLLRGELHVSS
ncbi:MAG: beta-ketoacyl synthase chain length factor [Treponema sp.]|nr:beta-ketoacyl synthase chain length factor [Treponema sp.]